DHRALVAGEVKPRIALGGARALVGLRLIGGGGAERFATMSRLDACELFGERAGRRWQRHRLSELPGFTAVITVNHVRATGHLFTETRAMVARHDQPAGF